MKIPRRKFLHLATGAAVLPAVSRIARAQTYPARPVRIIVGYPPGGGTDILARLIGQWLSERLGQQFIVDNRPGANSNIATEAVVRAPADGYTLLMVSAGVAINATLYDKLNFNFIRDIAPVAGVIGLPNVMEVNPSLPPKSVPEFIAYAKANPGKLNMASGGSGTAQHLAGELFKMMTDVNMAHVPYRGGAPAVTDLIGGQVQVMFSVITDSIEYIRAGKLRALAVTTASRSEALPDIPTVGEFVPGYEASAFFGVGAPKNTPPEIIDKLNKEINAALADPKMKARIAELGGTVLRVRTRLPRCKKQRNFRPRFGRNRLRRGPQRGDRTPLGRGSHRPTAGAGRRFGSPSGGSDRSTR
jgi:tripartite-type tricarboxylate transporter receptor subunit TctC